MTSIQIDRTDGLSSSVAIKGPCRVATTANVTLSGEQTIDGVAVVTDDRVLVKDQTAPSENGIYVVDTGAWRRAKDFSRTNDVRKGTRVGVTDGNASANTIWVCLSANPILVGTDDITISSAAGDAATLAGVTPGAAGLEILADATPGTVRTYLSNDEPLQSRWVGTLGDGSDDQAAFAAAFAATASGEEVLITPGTYVLGSNVAQTSKAIWWRAMAGVSMTVANLQKLVRDLVEPANYTVLSLSRRWTVGAGTTLAGNEFGDTFFYRIPNAADGSYEKDALHVAITTDDVEDGVGDYKAAVGISARAYIPATNTAGRAFGINPYAIIENGGDGTIVGAEINLYHNSSEVKLSLVDGDRKVGNIIANQGPVHATAALSIPQGAGGMGFFQIIESTPLAISVDPVASFIKLDGAFRVSRDGDVFIGKAFTDVQDTGVELQSSGNILVSATAAPSVIAGYRTGNLGVGNQPLQIDARGNNASGTAKTWAVQYATVVNATATAEEGRWDYYTMVAGAQVAQLLIGDGLQVGAPTGGKKGTGSINMQAALYNQGNQVVGARDTGWTVGTGTQLKGAFAAYAGATHTGAYVQATIQALDNAAKNASQRVLALEAAMRAHGLIN